MEAAGEQFLAGARSAQEHHRNVGVGDSLDGARDLRHLGRGGDHRAEDGAVVADLLLEPAILAFDLVELEGAPDDQAELIDVDRLLVEIIGARRDRAQRTFARAMARGDDHLGAGLEREDIVERGEAFGDAVGIGRQAEVQCHHRRLGGAHQIDRGVAVGRDQHLIIVIGPAQLALEPFVVLDDQELGLDVHVHARIRSR